MYFTFYELCIKFKYPIDIKLFVGSFISKCEVVLTSVFFYKDKCKADHYVQSQIPSSKNQVFISITQEH